MNQKINPERPFQGMFAERGIGTPTVSSGTRVPLSSYAKKMEPPTAEEQLDKLASDIELLADMKEIGI